MREERQHEANDFPFICWNHSVRFNEQVNGMRCFVDNITFGLGQREKVPRYYDTDVHRCGLQLHEDAERSEPRESGGSRHGGAPVLAAGRNQVLPGHQVLPVLHVRPDLPRGLPQAAAAVQGTVQTVAGWLRASHAAVRIQVAREDGVRPVSRQR